MRLFLISYADARVATLPLADASAAVDEYDCRGCCCRRLRKGEWVPVVEWVDSVSD